MDVHVSWYIISFTASTFPRLRCVEVAALRHWVLGFQSKESRERDRERERGREEGGGEAFLPGVGPRDGAGRGSLVVFFGGLLLGSQHVVREAQEREKSQRRELARE